MNSKVQGIIVCGVCAVCLGGVALFLSKTAPADKADSSSSSQSSKAEKEPDESVVILSREASDIVSVAVKNVNGEFTVEKPSSGKTNWVIEDLVSVSQDYTAEQSMVNNLGGFEAKKTAEENASDMSKYGLDDPKVSILVTYSDGETKTLYIGDEAPDARFVYARIDDESTVYMLYQRKLSYYTGKVTDYVNLTLIDKPSDDAWPEYGELRVVRKDLDYEMAFENSTDDTMGGISGQVMTEPVFSYLNITNSTDTTHGMWGLTAASCEVLEPTGDQLSEYGIADPYCEVTLKGEGYDYDLKIGNAVYEKDSEGNDTDMVSSYYCYITGVSGRNCIYNIAADSLPWASIKAEDVTSSLMTANYIYDLDSLQMKTADRDLGFEIKSSGSTFEQKDENDTPEVEKVTVDGKDLNVENFKAFYLYLMGCPTDEICFEEPTGESVLTITMNKKSGGKDVMEFYKDSSRRYIVKLNGVPSYRIASGWYDVCMQNIEAVLSDKEIEDTY